MYFGLILKVFWTVFKIRLKYIENSSAFAKLKTCLKQFLKTLKIGKKQDKNSFKDVF